MLEFLQQPMPWYVSGILIGLMVPLLLLLDNRQFGISSAYRHMCAAVLPKGKFSFFTYDWKAQRWNLVFVLGIVIGGFLASLTTPEGYATENQKNIISKKIKQITETLKVNVAAESYPFLKFWKAEKYHQDFKKNNKFNSYIINVSDPRFKRFKYKFSEIIKQNQ